MSREKPVSGSLDLFAPITAEGRWHPQFRSLVQSPFHRHARAFINALYARMGRIDKNFVQDFQTAGFHTRLFEIGCFAYLESAGFEFDRSHVSPDFLISRDGVRLAAEATSANSPHGRESDIALNRMENLSQEDILQKVTEEFPRRMANILSNKLKRKYHELPHCAGRPFVLMVAPLFEPGANFYTDHALVPCLYPCGRDALPENAAPPFFDMPGAEHVSAVLYINGYSVSRFFRASTLCGEGAEISGRRWGVCCIETKGGMIAYPEYEYDLGDGASEEPWCEGITTFLNPAALAPLREGALPCSSIFRFQNNSVRREILGFHPLTSFMQMWPTGEVANSKSR